MIVLLVAMAQLCPAGCGYGFVGACGRVGLAAAILAPACDGVVGGYGAVVPETGGYGFVGACGGVDLAGVVGAPACDCVVGGYGAGVPAACGYGFVGASGRVGLVQSLLPQHSMVSSAIPQLWDLPAATAV